MDTDYDRKFEEMKKYIPFLESMIKRLESTNSASSNPRQAQLNKIRSLRDLLLDKKKRMKMENLLKCEQVLINLYAKVEQRDYISGANGSSACISTMKSKELPDLEIVRNKLKSVSKRQQDAETLPEIARASEIEELCTPGSKEPALFQRRPNKSSLSPIKKSTTQENSLKSPIKSQLRRSYTRVLASPEPRRWSPTAPLNEKPLFSRRSPRGSPRRYSPSYHKKERKKSFKQESQSRKSKDLNITLNVPEESLNSLNTGDILSRIISCRDNDVDIDTLRELRHQILGELKQTGAKDDISDLILKSYKNKKSRNTNKKKKEDTEEGEISDSESEAIESIYGSLVVVEKEKNASNKVKVPTENSSNQARKIQICLVINSDKDTSSDNTSKEVNENQKIDVLDFQMYDDNNTINNREINTGDLKSAPCKDHKEGECTEKTNDKINEVILHKQLQEVNVTDIHNKKNCEGTESSNKDLSEINICTSNDQSGQEVDNEGETVQFKANFYKPLKEQENINVDDSRNVSSKSIERVDNNTNSTLSNLEDPKIDTSIEMSNDTIQSNVKDINAEFSKVTTSTIYSEDVSVNPEKTENNIEIPLLNEPIVPAKPTKADVLSEIDILKALKKEILSETIALPVAETVTPALHQPKVTKVASSQEILLKKRISIEKYKQKSVPSSAQPLFIREQNIMTKDDCIKKQSLKLTEKECERFNLAKVSLDEEDSSDNEEKRNMNISLDDIYGDLGPKSPDYDTTDLKTKSPVIIPVDAVKAKVNCQSDIDMRNLLPMCSNAALSSSSTSASSSLSLKPETYENEKTKEHNKNPGDKNRKLLMDPRVKRDSNQSVEKNSPDPHGINLERTSISIIPNNIVSNLSPNMGPSYNPSLAPSYSPSLTPSYNPNMTPSYNPSLTPSYNPNITPIVTTNARTYEMTPTHQSFEIDGLPKHKHVYAPSFPIFEPRESKDQSVPKELPKVPHWETNEKSVDNRISVWDKSKVNRTWKRDNRDPRSNSVQRDDVSQNSDYCKYDKFHKHQRNDKYYFHKRDSYSRSDCPRTPVPSFGWSDGPSTPTDAFGRLDTPTTPVHPFGRSDCPPTPSHSFGRSDCPSTPVHTFGQSECPRTPSHPFGRSENIMTPSNPFGRSDNSHKFSKDPRLNRSNKTEYDLCPQYDERDRGYHHDRGFNRGSSFKPHNRSYNNLDSVRNYENEKSVGRSESKRYYSEEQTGLHFSRERSVNRSLSKNSEGDRLFIRDRSNRRYEDNISMSYEEVGSRRNYQRERSIGRSMPDEKFSRSSRASSVGRNRIELETDNTLSDKSQAGRSFTINTSVNTTFQDLIESGKGIQVFDYSFNARRQRATSVGRSMVRENSVGRMMVERSDNSEYKDKNCRFQRASSVGRNLVHNKSNKSFQEIKADLKSYKSTLNTNKPESVTKNIYKRESDTKHTSKSRGGDSSWNKIKNYTPQRDPKTNKSTSQVYSPRKNYRDPRVRRVQRDMKNKNVYDESRRYSLDHKNYGIVYSSDNIAKGILGSGYAVKNYKIPKLKRPPEEIEELACIDKKETNNKTQTNDGKECTKKNTEADTLSINKSKDSKIGKKCKESISDGTTTKNKKLNTDKKLNIIIDDSPKRVTRSARKNCIDEKISSKDEGIVKTRKIRKPIIYDTDSETENNDIDTTQNAKCTFKINNELVNSVENDINKQNEKPLDSSFGIDDMEIFSDNIATDPVLDKINALIADLDHDLDNSKNESSDNFRTEMNIEKTCKNIKRPESNEQPLTDATLGDKAEVIEKDIIKNDKNIQENLTNIVHKNVIKESSDLSDSTTVKEQTSVTPDATKDKLENEKEKSTVIENKSETSEVLPVTINEISEESVNNDAIVSTTDTEITVNQEDIKLDERVDDHIDDRHHIPDSTINKSNDVPDQCAPESVPDSTYETQNDMNSVVTSTHDLADASNKDVGELSSSQTVVPAINSIGSLLSILQDRSKIKELLTLLGDQSSDSEKIKKKLEKLSEIVSDEEDSNDIILSNNKETREKTCKVSIDCEGNKESSATNQVEQVEKKVEDKSTDETEGELLAKEKNDHILKCNNQPIEKGNLVEVQLEAKDKTADETKDMLATREKNKEDYFCPEYNHQPTKPQLTEKEEINEKIDNVIVEKLATSNQKDIDENNVNEKDAKGITDEDIEKQKKYDIQVKQTENELGLAIIKTKKLPLKKSKVKKCKGSKFVKKPAISKEKRLTRAGAASIQTAKSASLKKPSRELLKLKEDIKEMFLSNDILSDTGIRMCRLAKLVDEKSANKKGDTYFQNAGPVVVLEKYKDANSEDVLEKVNKKRPGPKSKSKLLLKSTPVDAEIKKYIPITVPKYKPGPKSKTKFTHKREESDPYAFETDSVGDISKTKESEADDDSNSDSENDSLASSRSFGSSEVLADLKKKPKRKRRGWQAGFIKPKHRKKRDNRQTDSLMEDEVLLPQSSIGTIPDLTCFTDKTYCFRKNISIYSCRLCEYKGTDIVHHYKKQHSHSEIPLSRMDPSTAKEAIEQCEQINFQAITKIPTDRYVCRFCFKDFSKSKSVLENFFWHIVSMHTGEYKQICSECVNVSRCPFHLDIPPPPKDIKGQLIGYICGKCNYTQISLENLKTHVIVRHNDEQTEVYTINLAAMSKKIMTTLSRRCQVIEAPRVLRSSRSNQSVAEMSDDRSDVTESSDRISETDSTVNQPDSKPELSVLDTPVTQTNKVGLIQSKLTFENDDNTIEIRNIVNEEKSENSVKIEQDVGETDNHEQTSDFEVSLNTHINDRPIGREEEEVELPSGVSDDIMDYPHFKLHYTDAGNKEYLCCINGNDNHYKTALLISMKKHVQTKHSENWDGYCFLCKVIVTPQGVHSFKDCLQHFLDKHLDNFPVLEKIDEGSGEKQKFERTASPRTYINVRPLAELISKDTPNAVEVASREINTFPKIESVVSLGSATVEPPLPSPSYPSTVTKETQSEKLFKYEEVQAETMSKKHRVVLDTMMAKDKLVKVFKCAGRFCSFTSDSAEDALLHASTHQRIGGENALCCSYCDFDTSKNAIDLVMHVFKMHSRCQYSCSQCFYRAAASQLVGAHFTRAHGGVPEMGSVLRTTAITTPVVEDSANLLSREDAVPYYICNHGDGNCKFRTYTPGKFFEHLLQKHQYVTSHPCSLCSTTTSSPEELINHMKSHGLKLYQCTWCIHGANSEAELLDHTSTQHPTKQPQAYLRIITNKDGSAEMRVLPLAYLNKTKVPSEDVTPSHSKENPVREAERSIELEKLIGHTTMMIESAELVNASSNADAIDHQHQNITGDSLVFDTHNQSSEQVIRDVLPVINTSETSSSDVTFDQETRPAPAALANPVDPAAPELKSETIEQTSPKETQKEDVIYCLDSDEEDPRQSVIDLSDDNPLLNINNQNSTDPSGQKISLALLYKCPVTNCNVLYKSLWGFKKHVGVCGAQQKSLHCPHKPCTTVVSSVAGIIKHYNLKHLQAPQKSLNKFFCEVCNSSFSSLASARKHAKDLHKMQKFNVTSKREKNGEIRFTVRENYKDKELRRRSVETTKRYGPQDISQLPINPILDSSVHCALCEFNTKVRLNMVRHLQLHSEQQPVPQTAPVNPVPYLETNEKHFDKMVNLASSSIVTRAPDKQPRSDSNPVVSLRIPSEAASRYPKYVPERQRYTCGAKGCTYISVDEGMFKCHWDTLHTGTNDYRCVHCPPNQHVDTSQPLSAARIIAHLKMHGVTLYGCSTCSYYHCKKEILEKHVMTHKGGQVLVVREEVNPQGIPSTSQSVAPTMDLKPWQCGLCKFKSMLRPEVVEHCAKLHQSKMQYKCAYCPFRTSAIENITKHQLNSHPGKPEEVFYYYYREGSLCDDADGTPRWQKQQQKCGNSENEVKTELVESSSVIQPTAMPSVDLNLVKKEVNEPETLNSAASELPIEDLFERFGQFCEPNGLKYKCPLCKIIVEQNREAMQSHLYEELKYRKWGCRICSYKAFHRVGLNDHMTSEHSRQYQEPIELPVDVNIEKWVLNLLAHQATMIGKHQDNLSKQKLQVVKVGPSIQKMPEITNTSDVVDKHVAYTLEEAFGKFGAPINMQYCCPKCNYKVKDETSMKDHLESELTKIRWCCTKCNDNFQTYHEAQFHCKSVHPGQSAQPKEAIRDPLVRNGWITNVIQSQKSCMKFTLVSSEPTTPEKTDNSDAENSLLVVRYEEKVATPEVLSINRKRPAPAPDSDDERLVIDEQDSANKNNDMTKCPYCDFSSKYRHVLRDHKYRHFNLKPFTCMYCDFSGHRQTILHHVERSHVGSPFRMKNTELPSSATSPQFHNVRSNKKVVSEDDSGKTICLTCEKYVQENEVDSHIHDNWKPEFAKKGSVVVKCCICLVLRLDVKSLQEHHNSCHPEIPINYAYFKLYYDTREINYCGHCNKRFKFLRDLKTHHSAMHSSLPISYTSTPYSTLLHSSTTDEETEVGTKRKAGVSQLPAPKRIARKSTTKLPFNSVAKKSTTKLPVSMESEMESETATDYSYYGTKPPTLNQYGGVTMLMPICNTLVPISLKKLSGIIKISPHVVVKDYRKYAK